jgi:hypothetical protein
MTVSARGERGRQRHDTEGFGGTVHGRATFSRWWSCRGSAAALCPAIWRLPELPVPAQQTLLWLVWCAALDGATGSPP